MEISSHHDISKYDMETDISKLEAPTFTTIDRSNAPMLSLDWDHQVNLVGKKVVNPIIHSCDKCLKPILIYGRMIPCKHVFCLGCAKQEERSCPRCGDKVVRVEQAGLGNIFLCTSGGSRSVNFSSTSINFPVNKYSLSHTRQSQQFCETNDSFLSRVSSVKCQVSVQ